MSQQLRSRSGVSLIELLVVIAIIVLLIALLMPAIQRVRAAVDRMICGSNLRQMAIAAHHYHLDYGRFPAAAVVVPSPRMWVVDLLPYIEENNLYHRYRYDLSWDDPGNQPMVAKHIPLMVCPSATGVNSRGNRINGVEYGLCDYSPIADVDHRLIATGLLAPWNGNPLGVMSAEQGARIAEVCDGVSNTILIAEVAGRPESWIKGRFAGFTEVAGWATYNGVTPINLDGTSEDGTTLYGPCAINCNNIHEVYGFHVVGANVVFADGSVHFLKQTINIKVMAALVTRDGGEVVQSADFED